MKTLNTILLLSIFSFGLSANSKQVDFKTGTYLPVKASEACVESVLSWDEDTLVFGKDRFSNFNKEELKFSNVPKGDEGKTCDVFLKTMTEGSNKIILTYTTKCPAGSKYTSSELSKQTLTQVKNKIIFDASFTIDGALEASSYCEYKLKEPITAEK